MFVIPYLANSSHAPVAGGISYAEYSQEIQTAESSEKVSLLKNDALREVEKLKCSQNSNHL